MTTVYDKVEQLLNKFEEKLGEIEREIDEAKSYATYARDEASNAENQANEACGSADNALDYANNADSTRGELYTLYEALSTEFEALRTLDGEASTEPLSGLEADIRKHKKNVMDNHKSGASNKAIADHLKISEILVQQIIKRDRKAGMRIKQEAMKLEAIIVTDTCSNIRQVRSQCVTNRCITDSAGDSADTAKVLKELMTCKYCNMRRLLQCFQ